LGAVQIVVDLSLCVDMFLSILVQHAAVARQSVIGQVKEGLPERSSRCSIGCGHEKVFCLVKQPDVFVNI
jgi:hypothetical protein